MDNNCPCGKLGTQKCKKCNSKSYCSDSCVKSNWRRHKKHCIDSVKLDCSDFKNRFLISVESDIVALAFYSAGLCGCCLPSSLILAARLRKKGIDVQLKDGYVLYENGYSMRHVWLELTNGEVIDVGELISLKWYPGVYVGRKYFKSFPKGSYRIDYETNKEKLTIKLFERGIKLVRESCESSYWQQPDVPDVLRGVYKQLLTVY
jgi:hypothetical protein